MKLKGRLTISTVSSPDPKHPTGRYWRLRVLTEDKQVLMDVDIDMEPFALALSSVVEQPCRVRTPDGAYPKLTTPREHKLGCDEYHAHHAPDCCSPVCWCLTEGIRDA